jgi:FkbM family methyltransferase
MKAILRASVNLLPMWLRRSVKHLPGVAAIQRSFVTNVLSGGPFLHRINAGPAAGLRFEITLPDDKAIWSGTFESVFSHVLHDAVTPGDVCYDIGGYRGYMTGVLALAGASRVIVFEPVPENVARLKRLADLNPSLRIQVEQLAIGAEDGDVHFKVMADRSMGKLANSSFQEHRHAERDILVEVAQLDTVVFRRNSPRPNLIKIDVEGAELDVIEGASRTMRECRPVVLLEAHSLALAAACQQKFHQLGYQLREVGSSAGNNHGTRHFLAKPT